MRQTWRWFGPQDRVGIEDMLQAGVEGVVSALHHIPTGDVWSPEEISARQQLIAHKRDGSPSGLAWEVVESLPVSEDIKKQKGNWRTHIENYKRSMHNLAAAGIEVICYNFMPVLDWTRTDLTYRLPTGATCMRFDLIDFAAFDLFILKRKGASEDFPPEVIEEARARYDRLDEAGRDLLAGSIIYGLPGDAETPSMDRVRANLAEYDNISQDQLRRHFVAFLEEVAPVAQTLGLRLCCHPDDPPFGLLGLPRIMSTEADYKYLMDEVDIPANGITLCSGSLGARPDNDLPGMMKRFGDRVHFLHLRNVALESDAIKGSFYESEHLGGHVDMVALMQAALDEEARRKQEGRSDWSIPMRPDHGLDILDDQKRKAQPGYPAIGRLKGLAELRGIMVALQHLQQA
ncbi:mannonate dehydratase [uncultured Cohaesibacter sp.]|uniref:mannonate dehydratase n=1 Tax=uncultured Cohaesibacter sp. TaxID=1002546 RepID=UPI0029C89554|nr:mannonate dehydratase [uncultured Cohaesibacter sp.]